MILAAATSFAAEPGIEYGVSGSFGGMMGNVPVYAGGCNFPFDDPISVPASSKTFYCGIYNGLTGERIGSLPVKTAYGASAQTPKGLVMAGGSTADAWLLTADGTLCDLPPLPDKIDNGYGAAIGNTVYIVGGNINGEPSRGLVSLDLDNLHEGWKLVSVMPGLPRVQPVMAAAGGKLYVWGGFYGGEPKTVHTSGLCYDPSADTWVKLPEPAPGVTLTGGVAVTLDANRIVCTGGVNRRIFLDAITCQAPDYLEHPAEWYKFNDKIYIFHPLYYTWHCLDSNPECARAGSSTAVMPDDTILLMGGELKPRVRTPYPATLCADSTDKCKIKQPD